MNRFIFISSLLLIYVLNSCDSRNSALIEQMDKRAENIQKQFIPDKSLEAFNYELVYENGWILKGETTSETAGKKVISLADSLLGKDGYKNNFMLLPDPQLGDSSLALVVRSVGHLRREPRHASEMLDQVILGNELRLLKKHKSWYLVQNHYGYIGWITKYSIHTMDEESLNQWNSGPLLRVTELFGSVYAKPDMNSEKLSDLVLNATLKMISKKGKWTKVELPDAKQGYVLSRTIETLGKELPGREKLIANILKTAKSMIGVPYLWGGKSSKANDCSGFTQTVFKANGIQLARDARQQVLDGQEIIPDSTFSNVMPGDLVFFGSGKRITHVGMSLGGYEFIHQDRDAHIDSFNPNAENFNAFRKKTLRHIKRIIQ